MQLTKKKILGLGFLILSISLFSNFVSAQRGPIEDINNFIETILTGLQPLLELIVGSYDSSLYFFSAFLILIIIFSIIWIVLDKVELFSTHRGVLWIISLAVSILATRWFSKDIIEAIILPYTAIGIAISAGAPFRSLFSCY